MDTTKTTNLIDILETIPTDVARTPHGRSPDEGLDCAGLVLWAMKQWGRDISHLDLPYRHEDIGSKELQLLLLDQLRHNLIDVTEGWLAGFEKDGDIVLWRGRDGMAHVALYADRKVFEMADSLKIWQSRRVKLMMAAAFRLAAK